jgi:NADPH:quinone reductase-like Zn-dependent oxidoreductase
MSSSAVPASQSAVVAEQFGPLAESVKVVHDWPVPRPSARQLLVRVSHASMNAIDAKIPQGLCASWLPLKLPTVLGYDFAGTVVAVGSAAQRLKVGDEVYGNTWSSIGSFQQFALVEEKEAAIKPVTMSMAEAAGVGMAGETSLSALQPLLTSPGQRVVVIGATGGCGSFGLQIAKALGASEVIGVTSGRNLKLAQEMGADTVVDYTQSTLKEAGVAGVDVVYDTRGGYWPQAREVLKPGGVFITLAFWEPKPSDEERGSLQWLPHFCICHYEPLDKLRQWADEGRLKTTIDKVYPFTQQGVSSMYEDSFSGRVRGKLILDVAGGAK